MDRTTKIFRILSGIASKSENEEIAKWLSKSHENQSEFRNLKQLWTNMQHPQSEMNDSFYDGLRKIKQRFYARARKTRELQVFVSIVLIFTFVAISIIYLSFSAREKHLTFEKVRLQDVITAVEDRYRIKIETAGFEALNCAFTGSFNNVDGVDDVIRSISLALDLKYETLGNDRYRLFGNGCLTPQ